ncbi:DDE transposase, partial [Mucilaginibacter terrae]
YAYTLQTTYETLVRLLLPEGILEYFDLIDVAQTSAGLNIHLEEKNITPAGYENVKLESKGFLPETSIQDFPIRGHKVALCIKRRRWEVSESKTIITRNWDIVQKGARMTTEFGTFLKGIFG